MPANYDSLDPSPDDNEKTLWAKLALAVHTWATSGGATGLLVPQTDDNEKLLRYKIARNLYQLSLV